MHRGRSRREIYKVSMGRRSNKTWLLKRCEVRTIAFLSPFIVSKSPVMGTAVQYSQGGAVETARMVNRLSVVWNDFYTGTARYDIKTRVLMGAVDLRRECTSSWSRAMVLAMAMIQGDSVDAEAECVNASKVSRDRR